MYFLSHAWQHDTEAHVMQAYTFKTYTVHVAQQTYSCTSVSKCATVHVHAHAVHNNTAALAYMIVQLQLSVVGE